MSGFDASSVDVEAFARALDALAAEERARLGEDDVRHMRRLVRACRVLDVIGYAAAPFGPNPIAVGALALATTARFTLVGHHLLHGCLDRFDVPARYKKAGFARGRRRLSDYLDVVLPEAWAVEHNVLHHYSLGEVDDPDQVEEGFACVRERSRAFKVASLVGYALTFRQSYYGPSTFQVLYRGERRLRDGQRWDPRDDARNDTTYLSLYDPRTEEGRAYLRRCVLPWALARFVALPALFAPLGPLAVLSVAVNGALAEIVANVHAFAIVVPSHTGPDVHRFSTRGRGRAEHRVRQVLGTANYLPGGTVWSFLHGYLNYQIEHHLFPDLPPSALPRIAPKVRAVCNEYGVPYVVGTVRSRLRKLFDVVVRSNPMPVASTSPRSRERSARIVEEGRDEAAVAGHDDGVLELRGEAPVARDDRPAVGEGPHLGGA